MRRGERWRGGEFRSGHALLPQSPRKAPHLSGSTLIYWPLPRAVVGLERGAVCRCVGMRAPQHEQRARPSTRGVAREPAKATLRGLTSDVSQITPSELGEAPVLPSHVSQGASFQINILARSSMNTAVSTLGLAGAPPLQQLSPP